MPYRHNRKPSQRGDSYSTGNHAVSQKLRQAVRYVTILLR